MEETTLQFGVEIELLLGSRKKSYGSWKALAKDLSKRLAKAGIANHINDSNDKSPDNYREWSIVPEVTIPSQPNKGLCMLITLSSTTLSLTPLITVSLGQPPIRPPFPMFSYFPFQFPRSSQTPS